MSPHSPFDGPDRRSVAYAKANQEPPWDSILLSLYVRLYWIWRLNGKPRLCGSAERDLFSGFTNAETRT